MPQAPQTEEPEKPFEHFRVSKKSIKFVGQDGVPDRVRIKSPRFRVRPPPAVAQLAAAPSPAALAGSLTPSPPTPRSRRSER